MTVQEVISEFNMCSPNTLEDGIKYKWLSNAERHVVDLLSTYVVENDEALIKNIEKLKGGFTPEIDGPTELIAREPYSELYKYYLLAQLNLLYGDTAKYNVFATLHENELDKFRLWCVQRYRSKNENSRLGVI